MTCSMPIETLTAPCSTPTRRAWSATTDLLPHQIDAVAKLLPSRVGALFMEMGTGKTRTVIELARLRQAKIDRVVIFAPVAIKLTLQKEILKHSDCTEADINVFGDKTSAKTVPVACFWHIIGIESMSSSVRVIGAATALIDDRTMVIVDESTYLKGHFAKRTRRITLVSEKARYRLILTGTPITQGMVDLYSQMKFLSTKILGYNSFYSFAANHLVYSDKFKGLIVRTLNSEWIAERIKPYCYQVRKAECLDLPGKLFSSRYFALTTEQNAAYEQAKLDFVDDIERFDNGDGLQSGIAIFRLFSRLQSIVCGFDGGRTFKHNRLDALADVLDQVTDKQVVVWVKFQRSVDEIMARLAESGRTGYAFDGRVHQRDRQPLIDKWRADGGVLVATQSLGSHGLNELVSASTAIFYSNGFKYSERIQTEDRHHRIGMTAPVTYVDIWSDSGIENRIAAALATKSNALSQLRREIDAVKASDKKRIRELIMRL